ncbi:MAG TPA: D-aminoacylase [Bryobacteraceae bacterium]|jgi:N-acyl-D-amino-acid deacylase
MVRRNLKLLCAAILLAATASAAAPDYDILIRNARLVDGTGNPWFESDIGIKNGRIAAIGNLENKSATRSIDAAHRIAAPGFIDVHVHVEGEIDRVPRADNFLFDGVTTIITGNCGGSRLNLAQWFQKLEKQGIGVNLASFVGHNSVRSEVMGTANRLATPAEIERMQAVVNREMREGAIGFSTGLIYIPGTYSNTAEVVALAKAAAKYGGVYASHMRDEGPHVIEAIEEAVTVGKEAGMRVELSHFKIDTRSLWGMSEQTLALVEKYRREGVDVVLDQYPYDRSSTNLGMLVPSWALADGHDAVLKRLRDPATREKIATDMHDMLNKKGQPDYAFAAVASYAADRKYEGKTITEINVLKGRAQDVPHEIQTILDMMEAGGASMVYHSMGEVDVDRIMRYPNTAVASDGGVRVPGEGMPHPRSYGTNSRVLAEYVRTRHVLTLEDAIRRMTSLPARTFSFHDRGQLREGAAADIVIFDPDKVQDKATFLNPHQYSAGFDYVLVNGRIAVDDGKLTAVRGGAILRGSASPR